MTNVALAGTRPPAIESDVKQAVRDAVDAVTDFGWLQPGDTVFIKPVLNSGHPFPATTSPTALAAIIELLKEKGTGRCLVGDMAGNRYKEIIHEEVKYDPPKKILARLKKLESEIAKDLEELEAMLG